MKNILKFIYFILIISFCFACYNPDDYLNFDEDKIIYLEQKDTSILADGVNAARIEASISNEAVREKRSVIFKTDFGFFKDGKGDSIKVSANKYFKATTHLASFSTGTAKVSSEISGVTAKNNYIVNFERAFPEKINVSVDSFAIASDFKGEIVITALMGTNNGGKPSVGHEVTFSVIDEFGNQHGDFLNNINTGSSNTEGIVSLKFAIGKVDEDGYFTIVAMTNTETTPISDSTRIYVYKR